MDRSFLTPAPTPAEVLGTGRARALELLGAYTVDLDPYARESTLRRVTDDICGDPRATLAFVRALAEYAATLAECAAAASCEDGTIEASAFVRTLARVDLTTR
ncbi:hypothetical protein [Motilibacter aurantiacus]|uniref:hypothetical protein n=1 Tax=Motilibacter aurantiacus TaxID=2714955 RepID=UPI00140D45E3|nr:hypothetical protein [Motilibacter aurantiacus]NHC47474.1 hypothetical protein [Motilibacter aurantiacus]